MADPQPPFDLKPRLPLDEPEQPIPPSPPPGELDLRALDLQIAEADRFADIAGGQPTDDAPEALAVGPAQRAPFAVYEHTRSAVWPLVMALGVGVALGFAGGYGVGVHERSAPLVALVPAAPPAVGATAVREFTEGAIVDPVPATPVLDAKPVLERTVGPVAPAPQPVVNATKVAVPRQVAVPSKVTEKVRVGALTVESRPAGASVFVDDRLIGRTPLRLPEIAAGSHAVRIELDGYRRWSSSVGIAAGGRNRVAASLER